MHGNRTGLSPIAKRDCLLRANYDAPRDYQSRQGGDSSRISAGVTAKRRLFRTIPDWIGANSSARIRCHSGRFGQAAYRLRTIAARLPFTVPFQELLGLLVRRE